MVELSIIATFTIIDTFSPDALAKKFGLTPEQFGENLRDNYQRYDPEQHPMEPAETAREFISR